MNKKKKRKTGRRKRQLQRKYFLRKLILGISLVIAAGVLLCGGVSLVKKIRENANTVSMIAETSSGENGGIDMEQSDSLAAVKAAMARPAEFSPRCTESTKPSLYIDSTAIEVDGQTLANVSDYQPAAAHSFDAGLGYTDVDGIITFRGNNFRDTASYGCAQIKEGKIKDLWTAKTGSLTYGDATWTGSGWTGQPLMEKWSKEVKMTMNMYDWAKEKDDLVEVIYACMDGYVYFLDLETGEATRDPLYLGFTFKGSGALDPRGYPILYVGAGYDSNEGTARVFVVNLLDCSVMYTFGNNDPFSLRGNLSYFDSSALVDAKTDTLIYPGENGIFYLIRLNTQYDPEAGTLSISPDNIVKWHYYGTRTSVASYWLGMEDSAAIYDGYIFMSDNGGNLMCLDLNTLQLVWVQDILDDSNSSPVLSVEDGHLYLYISTSFRLGWRSNSTAEVPIWKIDAETGEIIWQKSYECASDDGVSGGVQSTIAPGREQLSDFIYVTVARTDGQAQGVLTCIDKSTGEVVWEHESAYAWSSPVCVYNPDGSGRVLYCNSTGHIYLLDGKTGDVLDTHQISDGVIEASPAVYKNYMVVGTRDCKIWGMELQ
ncbi:outer membrane protein assembly factor BamB family protein [Blautia sp. HCP3S3_H10_1]|uniref:outer membrane protein assembly factor BamB family protein n=1 Tax=unclassified Blautia TaxID=2648079 RepID=UPI003F8F8AFF|nr:PQQ-binding-like beta-propeller repeat protein [Clostridia bacterium]